MNDHPGRLAGKTTLLIGGARIGHTIARIFAEEGSDIAATYYADPGEVEGILGTVRGLGRKAEAVRMDVSDRESVRKGLAEVRELFPEIHILLNMASIFKPVEMDNVSEEDWEQNFRVHMLGTFWPAQLLAPDMPRGSHVITIADRTSLGKVYKGYLPYVVTKSGIAAMTRALAAELAPRGIFVNSIAPGPILRPQDISEAEWRTIRESSPLKYELTDEEAVSQFAWLALYLATTTMASGYIYPLDQGHNL